MANQHVSRRKDKIFAAATLMLVNRPVRGMASGQLIRVLDQHHIAYCPPACEGEGFTVVRPAVAVEFFLGQASESLRRATVDVLSPDAICPISVTDSLAVRYPAYPWLKFAEGGTSNNLTGFPSSIATIANCTGDLSSAR